MTTAPHPSLVWHHVPFGRRVMNPEAPYFVMAQSDVDDRGAARRRALIGLAGLH